MSEQARPAQALTPGAWKILLLVACLAISVSLCACGKRAGKVDAPPDVTDDEFPRTYPDISTDPKP